jgi:hypothetical protein
MSFEPRSVFRIALAFSLCLAGGCAVDSDADEEDDVEEEPTEVSSDELRSAVSCRERIDQAYTRGSPHAIAVIHVGGKPVSKPTGHAFLKMQAAAHAAGVRLSLTSGFRTMAEQRRLYNCYIKRSCNNGNIAARPGYSHHQNGLALDVSTSAWLTRNAARFGFVRTVRKEPWHFEYTGDSDPGGPCSVRQTTAAADAPPPATPPSAEEQELHPYLLPWVYPYQDGTYAAHDVPLKVRAWDPRIVRVVYRAGNYTLGESRDKTTDFAIAYSFSVLGERTLSAEGFDAGGAKVAESRVDVTLE